MTAPSGPATPDGSLVSARAEAEQLPMLSDAGKWLVFTTNGNKWYARTPTGEYAFADAQGLYEWRRPEPQGRSQRIDHSGGDRVGAKDGRAFRPGTGGDGNAKRRGIDETHHPRHQN